ncbi:unnamed protein product [Dicrocoelium dendriticum]|nr:unnamed protein product [Dicrocoelium dendriticum]
MVPFLLLKSSFLDSLSALVDKLLLQMRQLECMPIRHWDELIAATLGSVSGTGALHGSTPGYTIALVAELLKVLEPLNKLSRRQQYKLLQILLHTCVRLRQLVLQRTDCTVRAQGQFGSMLHQLIGVSVSQIREFLTTTLDVLAEYPISDHQSAVYLLKRMCTPVCPMDVDHSVFPISLDVWRGHEDYLLTRSRSELLNSDARGLGPRIQNVIHYICTGNNLTTDMGLETVCEGQILMPQLLLYDVYTQVWCANPNNTNKPMRLIYRIPGLESDNLPYLEHLATDQVPPEQYMHIGVLATHPHGLTDLFRRLTIVQDPFQGRDLLDVILHILKYCLKTPEFFERLTDLDLRSIPILLNVLLMCLQADRSRPDNASFDLHEDITGRLIRVLEPILQLADELDSSSPDAKDSNGRVIPKGDFNCFQQLLQCMSAQPDVPVVKNDVARLLGLLAFGDASKIETIVDFLKAHLSVISPSAEYSQLESAQLACCCSLMVFIQRQIRNGALLRRQIVEGAGVLQTCLHFLWDTVPPCALELEKGTALNTNDPEIAAFLSLPALPYVLQGLRACLSGDQDSECLSQSSDYQSRQPGRPAVTADRLLHLFHLLEMSKSAGRVGLLDEDMLTEWCSSKQTVGSRFKHLAVADSPPRSVTMASVIQRLRKSTSLRTRRLAFSMRQRQLQSLNMRVDEKGQVAVTESDRLANMTSALTEETGFGLRN